MLNARRLRGADLVNPVTLPADLDRAALGSQQRIALVKSATTTSPSGFSVTITECWASTLYAFGLAGGRRDLERLDAAIRSL